MGLLTGRTAIITGASKGIGREMSQMFAREGARVVCAARSAALVEETADLVRKAGGQAVAVVGDVATEDGARQAVAQALRAFGTVDRLVNNAGDGGPTKPVQEYTTEDWFYTINSCLTTSYMMTRFVVPEMIKAGNGAIVNVSSMAGRRGLAFRIGYCSAKAGQVGMTYGMALELAPHNITVNAIAPGAVEGDRIDRVIAGQARVRGIAPEAMRRAMLERSPLKRMTRGEDIAALAVFLCGDQARNLSGQCIAVNAGEPAG
ncbi:MAG: SDR family NAD(P)-dependent oxidoreductase [Candidatus Rokuibacteriota bacterium]